MSSSRAVPGLISTTGATHSTCAPSIVRVPQASLKPRLQAPSVAFLQGPELSKADQEC